MNPLSLVTHIGFLIACGKDVQSIVDNLVGKKEKFPSKEEFIKLLNDAIEFVGSGLLSIPDPLAKQIVPALQSAIDAIGKL